MVAKMAKYCKESYVCDPSRNAPFFHLDFNMSTKRDPTKNMNLFLMK